MHAEHAGNTERAVHRSRMPPLAPPLHARYKRLAWGMHSMTLTTSKHSCRRIPRWCGRGAQLPLGQHPARPCLNPPRAVFLYSAPQTSICSCHLTLAASPCTLSPASHAGRAVCCGKISSHRVTGADSMHGKPSPLPRPAPGMIKARPEGGSGSRAGLPEAEAGLAV